MSAGERITVIEGRLGSTRIAVLTITDDEFSAVQNVFDVTENIERTPYYVRPKRHTGSKHATSLLMPRFVQTLIRRMEHRSESSLSKCAYNIIVRQATERTNAPAGEAIARFVEHFSPEFFLLVGTAGGVSGREGIALGDVVIADYVDYGGFRKITSGQSLIRKIPYDHPSLLLREDFAGPIRRGGHWVKRIGLDLPKTTDDQSITPRGPRAIEANIVSTDNIWGDPSNDEQRKMLMEFDKAVAFETEAYGVAREIFNQRRSVNYNPQYLVVRGISDFVNVEGSDEQRRLWTPYAARAAAAFAYDLSEEILKNPVHQ